MQQPARMMLIRHAEKSDDGIEPPTGTGVRSDGSEDPESLTVRGWQRAGALAQLFRSRADLTPRVVFAAGTGPGSKSMRPIETVTPLVGVLKQDPQFAFVTKHLKGDLQALVDDALLRQGPVLIAWEHKVIPDLIRLLPEAPDVPAKWPGQRFDIVWILDRTATGWTFSQLPQLLLEGDSPHEIV